jgi:hypothetical protein
VEGLGIVPDRGRAWEFIIVVVLLGFCMSTLSSWLQQRFKGKSWLLITALSGFAVLFVSTVFFFYLKPKSFVVRIPIVVPLQRAANGDYAAINVPALGEGFLMEASVYFNEWYRRRKAKAPAFRLDGEELIDVVRDLALLEVLRELGTWYQASWLLEYYQRFPQLTYNFFQGLPDRGSDHPCEKWPESLRINNALLQELGCETGRSAPYHRPGWIDFKLPPGAAMQYHHDRRTLTIEDAYVEVEFSTSGNAGHGQGTGVVWLDKQLGIAHKGYRGPGLYHHVFVFLTIRAHSKRWMALGKGIKKRDQWLRSVVDILHRHFLWHSREGPLRPK